MTTYNQEQIEQMFTPKCEYRASESLKRNILEAVSKMQTDTPQPKRHPLLLRLLPTGIAAAVVLIAVILLSMPDNSVAYAADSPLSAAAEHFSKSPAFSATINVRTKESFPFSRVGLKRDFVAHTFTVQPGTGCWTIRKAKRTIVCDGTFTWQWLHDYPCGYKHDASQADETVDFFTSLLAPDELLKTEEANAKANPKIIAEKTEKDGIISLSIITPPTPIDFAEEEKKGNPIAKRFRLFDYYIREFDTKREYTLDKRSGKLLTMKITDRKSGKTIVEMTDIDYNVQVDITTFSIPAGIAWADMTEGGMRRKANSISRTDLFDVTNFVERVSAALHDWDMEVLKNAFAETDSATIEKQYGQFKGCTLRSTERRLLIDTWLVTFQQCHIRLADGTEMTRYIVIRNDNPLKAYIVDGGL